MLFWNQLKEETEIVLPPCTTENENDMTESLAKLDPIPLCPTRWCVRMNSLVRYKYQFPRIRKTLESIVEEAGAITADKKSSIQGYLEKLSKFSTMFFLHLGIEIFGPCEQLARALQKNKNHSNWRKTGSKTFGTNDSRASFWCAIPANLERGRRWSCQARTYLSRWAQNEKSSPTSRTNWLP